MRSIFTTALLATVASRSMALAVEYSFDQRDSAFDPTTNTGGQPLNAADGLGLKTFTEIGCFSAPGRGMVDMGVYTFQSTGWCQPLCWRQQYQYMALVNGSNCFCGNTLPDKSKYSASSDNCKGPNAVPCTGSDDVKCGGTNYWDIYNDGYYIGANTGTANIKVPSQTYTFPAYAASTSATSSSAQATVVVTQSASAAPAASTSADPSSSSGGNKIAIAVGVVVAVVVVLSIVGGVFFFMRRKKQKALAEEQRRHEMLTNFVTAEKPGSGYTSPDSRLDPSLMFQRRMSDGSIRDNEDYSRRILKVANPDD